MYLLALLTATAFLFTSATAKINGFSAPSTVVSGAPFDIQIHTENYIQAIEDVAIAFGIIGVEYAYPQTLGMLMGEKYLGPNNSNIVANITANVAVPTDQPEGPATITAALFSLIGARFSGNMEYFSVNVTIGKEMSTDYVTSEVEVVNSVATGSNSECTE